MNDFSTRKRQRFISKQYFDWLSAFQVQSIEKWTHTLPANGTEAVKHATAAWLRAASRFELMMLKYTAGEPLTSMRDELDDVVTSYEDYTARQRVARNDPQWPALLLTELSDYERTMQLIGLSHLLHRRDLLPRIAALEDSYYRGQDTLYEDLLAYALEGRVDVDQWYHESYRDCINSIYVDGDDESVAYLNAYLDNWYASMKSVGWHDSHLDLSERGGGYFGYWAVEAAAVAYLRGLDDTPLREQAVYPKDLVDFARTFEELPKSTPAPAGPQPVRTGQVCPETGIWKAQGHHVPGVLVQQGERMPEVFAPDRSGAYRSQPAFWEFERKA
ncbi:PoNe immunity protein domain-containing protein [Burkholderia sp. BCC1993]|uniref:PoNe immunity protein domain-containing protein n=1 Tax=Burkholderia sp. BCC1993 TaxID=2817444 RepID=UPI002AB1C857|nr:PoNe immunity protein domain-containing protein [Burkholderia sp. BCC1993]